ncbi:hypothetical protein HGRIS_010208 [Hohenbuehelia grisea]|uniref:Uncharacterized protein n=1 Tax=Hohenbuehelia grisea TaxID=104357 RepID=A0ABR3J3L4_9AGAR
MLISTQLINAISKRIAGVQLTYLNIDTLSPTDRCPGALSVTNKDFVVALNPIARDLDFPCMRNISITVGTRLATARVISWCNGCAVGGLDASETLFQYFAPLSEGRLTASWEFIDAPSSSIQPGSTSISFIPSSTPTALPPQSVAERPRSNPSLTIGSTIGGLSAVVLLACLFLFLRHRRRTRQYPETQTIKPYPALGPSSSVLRVAPASIAAAADEKARHRRAYIERQIRGLQDELLQFERSGRLKGHERPQHGELPIQSSTSSSLPSSLISSSSLPVLFALPAFSSAPSTSAMDDRPRTDGEQEIELMRSRVAELEAHLASAWAQGIGDDAPPDYASQVSSNSFT